MLRLSVISALNLFAAGCAKLIHHMFTGKSLAHFRGNLLNWFAEFQRELPWRENKDPYRIWLSEIMLQQTRVAAAIPYYERFLARFPTVKSLAEAAPDEVLRLWAGLGYYSRARNLQKAAKQIIAKHGGKFPLSRPEALELPGIGNYTSAAILSIAYGQQLAVLDGNVARVLARLGAIVGDLRAGERWRELQGIACSLLEPENPGDWNQAMMELGATVCMPKAPQCLLCPVAEFCDARKKGLVDSIPEKRKKRAKLEVVLAAVIFLDPSGKTLLLPPPKETAQSQQQSNVSALLSRMWHFPTIQVQTEATKELERQLQANLFAGRPPKFKLHPLKRVRHAVTYRSITLLPFRAEVQKLPRLRGAEAFALDDLSSIAVSNLTRKVARAALAP